MAFIPNIVQHLKKAVLASGKNRSLEASAETPFGSSPTAPEEDYLRLHAEAKQIKYPPVDKLEREYGAAIDKDWFEELALQTQVVVKKSKLNYQHGRMLYSILKNYMADTSKGEPATILETGTARGFSAVCMAKALKDGNHPGTIITVDTLPHHTPMYWNCINDHKGVNTRQDLLKNYEGLLSRIVFLQGKTDAVLPKLGLKRINMAFLDATHKYDAVIHEFRYVEARQRQGDIVFFDDVTPELFPGVCDAVDTIENEHQYSVKRLQITSQRGYAIAKRR